MPWKLRPYQPRDFAALHRLDQDCFPPGIAYTRAGLRYFLNQNGAQCLVAEEGRRIVGFLVAEENRPLAHIITLDVEEGHRKRGVGTALLKEMEQNLAARGVQAILLEAAVNNETAVAFWRKHGYRSEAVLKRYYLGRVDAYEMRKVLPGAGEAGRSEEKSRER
ncbi:MAG: GNAT family N-acetyltransferase [Acidobacteriia bacterium]|nr:GNAT family N-acetyltransferase [Terriglobia bacterium]